MIGDDTYADMRTTNKYKKSLIKSNICPKCFSPLKTGMAIEPDMEYGARYLIPPPLINSDTIELISVKKCVNCGHSESND